MQTKTQIKDAISKYTPVQALALAIVNFENHGFIRSGMGYNEYDDDGKHVRTISDSKTTLIEQMMSDVVPHKSYVDQAQQIIEKFNGKFMMKKLTNGLNDFEAGVAQAFEAGNKMSAFHVAIIASIPNMNKVDEKRQQVENRLEAVRFDSQHFGNVRERYDISVDVLDCKFIQSSGVYIITTLYQNRDIVKFWWRDQPDISDIIEGKTIRIRGTVNKHETGRFTGAKETMINRVKIQS
jgi:hypothetical protein